MEIGFDPAKRAKTLAERNLDFRDAVKVFKGLTYTAVDDRNDYGEARYVTFGLLDARMIVLVWTPRGTKRHIISMRKCNAREQKKYKAKLG